MRYVFYINPLAGKGNAQEDIIKSINDYFSDKTYDYKIHFRNSIDDMMRSASNEAKTGDNIRMFACGGEGTVMAVLNSIVGYSNVELGVIPCGSANDFLKFFENRNSFLDIAEQIDGESVEMDLI